jgi:hypothetical protein
VCTCWRSLLWIRLRLCAHRAHFAWHVASSTVSSKMLCEVLYLWHAHTEGSILLCAELTAYLKNSTWHYQNSLESCKNENIFLSNWKIDQGNVNGFMSSVNRDILLESSTISIEMQEFILISSKTI